MASNFWSIYQHAGHIEVSDSQGNTVRLDLCRDGWHRLGIVVEGEEFTADAGRLSANFGPDGKGFQSEFAAENYAGNHLVN